DRLLRAAGVWASTGGVWAGLGAVARPLRRGGRRRAVALGGGAVVAVPALDVLRRREIHARAQELEHHLAAVVDAVAARAHDHPVLGLARTRRDEHTRALDLDDAHPAGVDGRQRLAVA